MVRIVPMLAAIVLSVGLVTADAQDKKADEPKQKQRDLSSITGKITDVNLNEKTKKLESLYVRTKLGNRYTNYGVRINDETRFEYEGSKEKKVDPPNVGDSVDVKINKETDYATTVTITKSAKKK